MDLVLNAERGTKNRLLLYRKLKELAALLEKTRQSELLGLLEIETAERGFVVLTMPVTPRVNRYYEWR